MTAFLTLLADHRIVLPLLYSLYKKQVIIINIFKIIDDMKGGKKRAIPMTICL